MSRFLWRADFTARCVMLFAFTAVQAAFQGLSLETAVTPAGLLAMFTVIARHQRREARAFLQTLPISRAALVRNEAIIDLLPALAMGMVAVTMVMGGVVMVPTFVLAVLFGIIWSQGEPTWWKRAGAILSLFLVALPLNAWSPLATAVACVATAGWILVRGDDQTEMVKADAGLSPERRASQAMSIPLLRSRLMAVTALGSGFNVLFLAWSAILTWTATRGGLRSTREALLPLLLGAQPAVITALRTKGPASEFMLARPVPRWRYFLPPIIVTLAIVLMPTTGELLRARNLPNAELDAWIRDSVWSFHPSTRPVGSSREDWEGQYTRALSAKIALPALPQGALEQNSRVDEHLPWVPTAQLVRAVRTAWQLRQLRIALLEALMCFLILALTRPVDTLTARSGNRQRWLWAFIGIPLVLFPEYPQLLQFPVWPLLLLVVIAAARLWRNTMSADIA